MTIEILETDPLPYSHLAHAVCVRAGPWVFINGLEATDANHSLAVEVAGEPGLSLHGLPRHRREGDFIAQRLKSLLAHAGTSFLNTVRLDQYYPTWQAVNPYHRARRAAFGDYIPPSTSVVMDGLLVDGAAICTNLMAVVPGSGLEPKRVDPPAVSAPTWSGFVPAATVGDYVFVAGQMARGDDGPDPRAHVPKHSRWGGYEARKQAEFVIDHRLAPALAAAGASLSGALKAQAYLRHPQDLPHFLEVWNDRFGDRQVALTIVQANDFGLVDGSLEINLVALRDGVATTKTVLDVDIPPEATFGAPGVLGGDLLFASGLMACDRHGLDTSVSAAAGLHYFGAPARAEMACLLRHAMKVCEAGGTTAASITRAMQFQSDLSGLRDTLAIWDQVAGVRSVPYCAVKAASHPVAGCTTTLDFWAWAGR
jgi:enamine deaminase RidA (YjgF/YER057c/UK114 family)